MDGVGVLSLHLQPRKCRECGALRWSESSSAWLKSKIEETDVYKFYTQKKKKYAKTHTDARQEACKLLRGVSESDRKARKNKQINPHIQLDIAHCGGFN